jgi:hypothetical protein
MTAAGPVDPELFARTAPAWNCVASDGPHYLNAAGGCQWCGRSREAIADLDAEAAAEAALRDDIRRALVRRYGAAVPVTDQMIDAVLAAL